MWWRGVYRGAGLAYYSAYLVELMHHNTRAVECPCCEWEGNRFFPFVDHVTRSRKDAACSRCGFNDRYRFYLANVRLRTEFFSGPWRLLDIVPLHTSNR